MATRPPFQPVPSHVLVLSCHAQAPWPRVLLVLPLAAFERTTIGFRLQKLEVHFDLSACGSGSGGGGGGDDSGSSRGGSFAAVAAANEELGGGGEERISVVLLTRDRYVCCTRHGSAGGYAR